MCICEMHQRERDDEFLRKKPTNSPPREKVEEIDNESQERTEENCILSGFVNSIENRKK